LDAGRSYVKSVPVGEPYHLNEERLEGADAEGGVCHVYPGILVEPNRWIVMACEEARASLGSGGGPFGAVLLQVDDGTGEVIRFWRDHNHVVERSDPTAHAEISVIRSSCQELGVIDLGAIRRDVSRLPQEGETSHCEIYSSCEPCPMCYSAIAWARIPVLVFSASCKDASGKGVGFLDEELKEDVCRGYGDRKVKVFQAVCPGTMDVFEMWKGGGYERY